MNPYSQIWAVKQNNRLDQWYKEWYKDRENSKKKSLRIERITKLQQIENKIKTK